MIVPGQSVIRRIISNVRPVDLTLKRVKTWTSPGIVDFDNSLQQNPSTVEIPFITQNKQLDDSSEQSHSPISNHAAKFEKPQYARQDSVMLKPGAYLVEFNETVDTPLSLMGQIFVRSSLFRSGALLSAGVMDSGYKGTADAMLQVTNPHGLLLYRDARMAQMIFHQKSEPVEGYNGVYQGSGSVLESHSVRTGP